jgi:hypothetical protein
MTITATTLNSKAEFANERFISRFLRFSHCCVSKCGESEKDYISTFATQQTTEHAQVFFIFC